MPISDKSAWIFFLSAMVGSADIVYSQSYPIKPIRIVTADAGGNADFVARLVGQGISPQLGQPVIVDNRSSIISVEVASRAVPDGYTLLAQGGPVWLTPLFQKVAYDPINDFSPISLVSRQFTVLVVHPSSAAHSVKELIALAKAKPGELNYGSQQNGSTNHLGAELFKAMAGVNIVRIFYKGAAQLINDQIAGNVDLSFASPPSVAQHIKSGRLRVLAVTSAQPSALFQGVPTVAAAGVPGYEAVSLNGIFAPTKTPAEIIDRLNHAIVGYLHSAQARDRFVASFAEPVGSSPEEFSLAIRAETVKWSKVIKDADIKGE